MYPKLILGGTIEKAPPSPVFCALIPVTDIEVLPVKVVLFITMGLPPPPSGPMIVAPADANKAKFSTA